MCSVLCQFCLRERTRHVLKVLFGALLGGDNLLILSFCFYLWVIL